MATCNVLLQVAFLLEEAVTLQLSSPDFPGAGGNFKMIAIFGA